MFPATLAGVAAVVIVVAVIVQFAHSDQSRTAMWLAAIGGLALAGSGAFGRAIVNAVASTTQAANKFTGWAFGASVGGTLVLVLLVMWFYHRAHKGNGLKAGQKVKSKHLGRGMQLLGLCTCVALGTVVATDVSMVHAVAQQAVSQASDFLH